MISYDLGTNLDMAQAELEAEDNASESAEINSCLARKIRERH